TTTPATAAERILCGAFASRATNVQTLTSARHATIKGRHPPRWHRYTIHERTRSAPPKLQKSHADYPCPPTFVPVATHAPSLDADSNALNVRAISRCAKSASLPRRRLGTISHLMRSS